MYSNPDVEVRIQICTSLSLPIFVVLVQMYGVTFVTANFVDVHVLLSNLRPLCRHQRRIVCLYFQQLFNGWLRGLKIAKIIYVVQLLAKSWHYVHI